MAMVLDARQVMLLAQSGLQPPAAPAPVPAPAPAPPKRTKRAQNLAPVLSARAVPACCGALMQPGDRDGAFQCPHCSRAEFEEAGRTGRRPAHEVARATIYNELLDYNEQYLKTHGRQIPRQLLGEAADLFMAAKAFDEFRDTKVGSKRISILAAILGYVCERGGMNLVEADVRNFLNVEPFRGVKIRFSLGVKILRQMHNRKVGGVDLSVSNTRALLRSNLIFLGLLGTDRTAPAFPAPPGVDVEQLGYAVLDRSEDLGIAPGVQPRTRTLGCIWFLVLALQRRFPGSGYDALRLRELAQKCEIGEATILNFQRAVSEHEIALFEDEPEC